MKMLCMVDEFMHIDDDIYAYVWSKQYHGTCILGIGITLVLFVCMCGLGRHLVLALQLSILPWYLPMVVAWRLPWHRDPLNWHKHGIYPWY